MALEFISLVKGAEVEIMQLVYLEIPTLHRCRAVGLTINMSYLQNSLSFSFFFFFLQFTRLVSL